jgi:hypothetical protein
MKLAIVVIALCFGVTENLISQNYINRGKDFLAPADFNFPVRVYMWELTGDDPFIDPSQRFEIGLSYNYSSAEKYFNPEGEGVFVKESFGQYNKGNDIGGYFRKHGAILWAQYNFGKVNKIVLRLPFTFTEMKSYSSTTDVKPQEAFIKPRGPFQDVELSYTRNIFKVKKMIDFFAGLGFTLPTSRPKRYLDSPHGGNGDRWTANVNGYISFSNKKITAATGIKYIYKFSSNNELFTPRPFGIGYPFLYDTASISSEQMNDFITANPYEAAVKPGYHLIYDFVFEYKFKFGLQPSLQFQYFKSSGDEFDTPIPVEFTRNSGGEIAPVNFIDKLEGGSSGTIRIYLKQNFEKITGSKFNVVLGFGTSIFGKNAQQEANLLFGVLGYF